MRLRRPCAAEYDTGIFRTKLNRIGNAVFTRGKFHHNTLSRPYLAGLSERARLVSCGRDARDLTLGRNLNCRLPRLSGKCAQQRRDCNVKLFHVFHVVFT